MPALYAPTETEIACLGARLLGYPEHAPGELPEMTRNTFTVPDGAEPVLDAEGRATGELTTTPNHAADAGVRVKPLEWEAGGASSFRAESLAGRYVIGADEKSHRGWQWGLVGDPREWVVSEFFGSPDEAKAAAQADYERRIRSALLPTPAPAARKPETGVSGVHPVAALAQCEASFEQIRTILVNHLDEPEASAFWEAVRGRDHAAIAIAALSASHRTHPGREEIRNEALEEAAAEMDALAEGAAHVAETIILDWVSPENSGEDNLANRRDAIEHRYAAKIYRASAIAIRSLKSPPHSTPPTSSKVATDDTLDGMAGQ